MSGDDAELNERRRKRLADKAEADAAAMTVAERLTRRAKSKTVALTLSDLEGDFIINMRQPTRAELDRLLKYQTAIQKPDEQEDANKKMCFMIGDLCTDDSLNAEFWESGDYAIDDLVTIIQKLFENFVTIIKEAESFRPNRTRARPTPDVRAPGEVSP